MRPGRAITVGLLLVVSSLLVARSLTYTLWYQHWIYGRMSLEQLTVSARQMPGEAVVLYHYGKVLNAKGRFSEALVPLEKAAGLDPDDPLIRGEWSTAQLAGGYITGAFGQLTQFSRTHPDSAQGHMFLGRFYVAQNSYVRATEELEQAVKLDPKSGEAWSLLAGARLQMGGLVLARDAARQAVALRPKSAVDHMLLASLLLSTNDRSGARQEYATAASLAPQNPDYLSEYSHLLLKDGDTRDIALAEQISRRAVALNPQSLIARYDLGRALALQGKTAEAIEPLTAAATTLPPGMTRSTLPANAPEQFLTPEPALELARAYRTLGRIQEAGTWEKMYLRRKQRVEEERRLGDAIRNHPEQTKLRHQMALLLAKRGDVEGVAKNIARARSSAPDAPQVLVETANALAAEGYGALAAPLARRATVFSKNSPAAYEAWGNALLAMGRGHEAAVKYAKAAGWWPNKMPLYRRSLTAFYNRRRQHPSEAEKLFLRACALEDARLGLPYNVDQVKTLLGQAVALDPQNSDYRRMLLRVLVSRHEAVEAENTARELLALSPEDGTAHALLAVILLKKADSEKFLSEAELHLKTAEQDDSVRAVVHYGQGILAMRRQQTQEAIRLLRLSVAEEPADAAYYELAQAERLNGNTTAATKIMTELNARVQFNQQAIARMQRLARAPDDRQAYTEAVRFYTAHGMKAQAEAIEVAKKHRFPNEH